MDLGLVRTQLLPVAVGINNVHRVRAHLDGQRDLANHVARMRANHAAAQDLAVAVGLG